MKPSPHTGISLGMASKDVLKEGTRSPQGARKHLFSRESDLPTDAGEQRSAVLRVGRQLGRLAEALPGAAPHFQAQRSLSARKLSQCPEGRGAAAHQRRPSAAPWLCSTPWTPKRQSPGQGRPPSEAQTEGASAATGHGGSLPGSCPRRCAVWVFAHQA